jgi:hypothetical protein
MNINASSQSLINTLLQQASKSNEKKRPTFEQVFAKLNARSSKMNANRQPINSMLTNEQLFRYYIRETEPKLQISNETFSSDELFNPMKESDPTKTYGSASTLTSDIAQLINPANNLPIVGVPDAPTRPRPRNNLPNQTSNNAPSNRGIPRIPTMITAPASAASASAASASAASIAYIPPESFGTARLARAELVPVEIFADLEEADNYYREALNAVDKFSGLNWGSIPEETTDLFKILFSPDYEDHSIYYLNLLIDGGNIEPAISGLFDIFYQARNNEYANDFIVAKIKGIVGADFSAGIAVKEQFDKLYNPNNVSQQEFIANIRTKIKAIASYNDTEKARMGRDLALIDTQELSALATAYVARAEQEYFDLRGKYNARVLVSGDPIDPVQIFNNATQNERNAEAIFTSLMEDMFNDVATEMTTNTGINSTELDPELATKLVNMNKRRGIGLPSLDIPSLSPTSPAYSTIAEAGSGEANIEDVIMRRGRGVQLGDVRGKYEKTRKREGAATLQASIRRALEQQGMGAKGSV